MAEPIVDVFRVGVQYDVDVLWDEGCFGTDFACERIEIAPEEYVCRPYFVQPPVFGLGFAVDQAGDVYIDVDPRNSYCMSALNEGECSSPKERVYEFKLTRDDKLATLAGWDRCFLDEETGTAEETYCRRGIYYYLTPGTPKKLVPKPVTGSWYKGISRWVDTDWDQEGFKDCLFDERNTSYYGKTDERSHYNNKIKGLTQDQKIIVERFFRAIEEFYKVR